MQSLNDKQLRLKINYIHVQPVLDLNYISEERVIRHQNFHKPTLTILFKHLIKSQMIDSGVQLIPHQELRGWFIYHRKKHICILNAGTYYNKWMENYVLLFNIFYVNLNLQLFSNKFFIDETLAINWDTNLYTHQLFKNIKPVYFLNPVAYGLKTKTVFSWFKQHLPDAIIILDIKTHEKTIPFLKRIGAFLIGLMPMNYNPWLVSHPMLVFMDGLFIQHFFIKFILFAKQQAASKQYDYNKNLYHSTLFFSN